MSDEARVLNNVGTEPKIPKGWKLTHIYLRDGSVINTCVPESWRWDFSDGGDSLPSYDILSYRIEKVDGGKWVSDVAGRKSSAGALESGVAGRKDDAGKPRVGEVLDGFKRALWAVSKVGTWGGEVKYADRPFDNWTRVEDGIRRYDNGRARHYLAVVDNDPESGMPHEWHAVWCALAALELRLREEENVGE